MGFLAPLQEGDMVLVQVSRLQGSYKFPIAAAATATAATAEV